MNPWQKEKIWRRPGAARRAMSARSSSAGPSQSPRNASRTEKSGIGSAVLLEIAQRLVVQNHEAREVEILESAEGNDRIIRPRHARTVVHRAEQRSQLADARLDDRRDDHEM